MRTVANRRAPAIGSGIQLAAIPAPFRVVGSPELQRATAALGRELIQASGAEPPS